MKEPVDITKIVALFESFRCAFPHLRVELVREHPHVDLLMDFPEQPGLTFSVSLNLQGDELHLSAGHFWLEWFPCTKPEVLAAYAEAVSGLLSGAFRIVEHYRGHRATKAQLQRPTDGGWETIGTWSTISLPFPWRTRMQVLQNLASQ